MRSTRPRLEPAAPQLRRNDRLDRFQLLGGIHAQIDLGGADIGMAEPECDLPDVVGGLQHDHGTAMPELMWRDATTTQRCAGLGRFADVLVEDIFEACSGHRLASGVDEQFRYGNIAPDTEPRPKIARGFLPERQAAFLAALSPDRHARALLEREVCGQGPDQFGDPQAASKAQMQHRPISHAGSGRNIGSIEDRANLLHRQMTDELLIVAFDRDRMDPANLLRADGTRYST